MSAPGFVLIVAVALTIAVIARRALSGGAVELGLLRSRRAQSRDDSSDIGSAPDYHSALTASERADALDDRTWQDLDLDDVFLSLDRTASQPGRQFLYHLLRTPRFSTEQLERLERSVGRLARDDALAERVRAVLATLDDRRAARIVRLIFGDLPPRPRLWWIFPALTVSSFVCLASIVIWPRALIVWLGICVANILAQIIYKRRVKEFIPALHEIPHLVTAARVLGELDLAECAGEVERLRDGARRLGVLRSLTLWLMFEPGQTNELVASFYEYVNLLFLLDVTAFVFAAESLRASRELLRGVFEAIGYLDAVQTIAVWRASLSRWSVPVLSGAAKQLRAESVVHPLLADPIPNSLTMDGAGMLITGSNMSGKTTFVRTIGVNAVLAQTLHTVCATAWQSPLLQVRTSIGRSDSIVEGKSYYLAEVISVGGLVSAKRPDRQHLFLLDEIFRGTNTTERVAAGYAVLAHLNRGHDLVIVATHDIEVINLLGEQYTSYHFREEIACGTITFDYRLQPGPASTRNAIALLELMNYPSELVAAAIATLDWKDRGTRSWRSESDT